MLRCGIRMGPIVLRGCVLKIGMGRIGEEWMMVAGIMMGIRRLVVLILAIGSRMMLIKIRGVG